jgi:hypothetical protein
MHEVRMWGAQPPAGQYVACPHGIKSVLSSCVEILNLPGACLMVAWLSVIQAETPIHSDVRCSAGTFALTKKN